MFRYQTAVIELNSRAVIGWSIKSTITTAVVMDALIVAVWRRCKDNHSVPSVSRQGNCWDNAVVESFFSKLKKERIKLRTCDSRQEAKSDVFGYIEVFFNRVRRRSQPDQMRPLCVRATSVPI